jgi:hypothetical protein
MLSLFPLAPSPGFGQFLSASGYRLAMEHHPFVENLRGKGPEAFDFLWGPAMNFELAKADYPWDWNFLESQIPCQCPVIHPELFCHLSSCY